MRAGGRRSLRSYLRTPDGKTAVRAMEGPLDPVDVRRQPRQHAPQPRPAAVSASAPLPPPIRSARSRLTDPDVPVDVRIEAFNPLVPGDADASGFPVAVLRYRAAQQERPAGDGVRLRNAAELHRHGRLGKRATGRATCIRRAKANRNAFRRRRRAAGHLHDVRRRRPRASAVGHDGSGDHGRARRHLPHRPGRKRQLGRRAARFLGRPQRRRTRSNERKRQPTDLPMASLARPHRAASPATTREGHLSPGLALSQPPHLDTADERDARRRTAIGNYYTTQYNDAWDVAENVVPRIWHDLEDKTRRFVRAFCDSDLPTEVKEAALYNLSTLRTQTCFRTPDGRFYGWEGCVRQRAAATARAPTSGTTSRRRRFSLATWRMSMREVEFAHATDDDGLMSFRVSLPLDRAQDFGKAAADGQMGCIMKMYRDWQLSGDDDRLRALWPKVKKGAGVLLDPGRLGRRPGRRDGRLPAQHDGRRVLRPQSADGHLVSRGAAGGGGDGASTWASAVCATSAGSSSSTAARGSTRTCSTASTTSTRSACPGCADDRAQPADRHGGRGPGRTRLPARRGLPGRPAGRAVHGARLRAGLPGQAGAHPQTLRSILKYNYRRDSTTISTTCARLPWARSRRC